MNKIKVYEFEVSNASSSPCSEDYKEIWFGKELDKLSSTYEIEHTINDFLETNNYILVDLKVNNVDINYHNNARGNTIKLVYTIIYKEREK